MSILYCKLKYFQQADCYCPPLCTEKNKIYKALATLNQADQSIKCKALLSSAMILDIDPLEELTL